MNQTSAMAITASDPPVSTNLGYDQGARGSSRSAIIEPKLDMVRYVGCLLLVISSPQDEMLQ